MFADSESNLALQIQVPHTLMNIRWCVGTSRKLEISLKKNVLLDPVAVLRDNHCYSELEGSRHLNMQRASESPGGLVTSQISGLHPLESLLQ